jgi:hypothetical protein
LSVEYELLEPTSNPQKDVEKLAVEFVDILIEFWEKVGKNHFGADKLDVLPLSLAQLWSSRNLRIFMAHEDGKPVGFLMGTHVRPFFYEELVFQVEAYYGRTPEIEAGLLAFVVDKFKYFQDKRLLLPDYGKPVAPSGFDLVGSLAYKAFRKV